jgi:glycosyltransferase involved in cell wall biosynthesis
MLSSTSFPKVSIIIPTHNRSNYIIQTIRSVQEQTYKNWELLIVDDGSEDNTEEAIAQLRDDRIQFIKAGRIGIAGAIKNLGLTFATGELIAFVDSDDLWAAEKIEKQVLALQQFPDAGFCLTNGYNFRTLNEPEEYFYKKQEGVLHGNIFLSFFKSEICGFIQVLMFRKNCMQLTGPFKEGKPFSDSDFLVSLGFHFNAVILYEPLSYRRLHNTNYGNPIWINSYHEGIQIINDYRNDIPAKIHQTALFNLFINFGESCLQRKMSGKAMLQFFKAWKHRPLSIVPLKKTGKAILHSFGMK